MFQYKLKLWFKKILPFSGHNFNFYISCCRHTLYSESKMVVINIRMITKSNKNHLIKINAQSIYTYVFATFHVKDLSLLFFFYISPLFFSEQLFYYYIYWNIFTLCNWPLKVMTPSDPLPDNSHILQSHCLLWMKCFSSLPFCTCNYELSIETRDLYQCFKFSLKVL